MINPNRLKKLLEEIVDKIIPHNPDCNLVREYGTWGIGCTCTAGDYRERFKEDIQKLEEEE